MPIPSEMTLHQQSKRLELAYENGERFQLPCEYLRVYSQSAEVTGHAPGQEVLQLNKQAVNITEITPVGNYAVTLHFDDGHNTGIYTWDRLYDLAKNQETYWVAYLRKVMRAGETHPDLEKRKQLLQP